MWSSVRCDLGYLRRDVYRQAALCRDAFQWFITFDSGVVNQSNIAEVLHPIPLEFPATYTTYKARSDNSVEITFDVTTKTRFVEYLVNLLKTSETRDVFELKDPR